MSIRICLYCGKEFEGEGKQRYCDRRCMQKQWYEDNYKPKEPVEKECLYCGKKFIAKRITQMFCSTPCNTKHNRRDKADKKYCLQCRKELEVLSNARFCNEECRNTYNIENPKYTRQCVYCGEVFKTNESKKKLCSKECQNEYQAISTLEIREKEFKKKFESRYHDFKYVSGYINWRSYIVVKCLICGQMQEKNATCIKPEAGERLLCDNCIQLRVQRRALVNILAKRHNYLEKEQSRIKREKELEKQRQEREELLEGRICEECGEKYDAISISQKFCSTKCANRNQDRRRPCDNQWSN